LKKQPAIASNMEKETPVLLIGFESVAAFYGRERMP